MSSTVRCKLKLHSITQHKFCINPKDESGELIKNPVGEDGKTLNNLPIFKQVESLIDPDGLPSYSVRFGAVWEDRCGPHRTDENVVFGFYTPQAEFNACIKNQAAIDSLEVGKEYYFDITPAS